MDTLYVWRLQNAITREGTSVETVRAGLHIVAGWSNVSSGCICLSHEPALLEEGSVGLMKEGRVPQTQDAQGS